MVVITQAIDSGDGVFIGGQHLRYTHNTLTTMTTSFINESIDQELSIEELGQANGGLGPIGVILAVKLGGAAVAAVGAGIAYGVSKLVDGNDKDCSQDCDSKVSDSKE